MRYLVTGASGFVGQPLCAALLERGQLVRTAVRHAQARQGNGDVAAVGPIDGNTRWEDALRGVDAVVHLAARVHVMQDSAADPLAEFLKVNLEGTANLAQQVVSAGVRRLVYVSSIKVNGERTSATQPFTENDAAHPQDPYGVSKWRAEQALHRIAADTGLEVVIVRPPLVYGPGVKGNFIRLLAAVDKGIPLPLASAHNLRSLVFVGNLVDALVCCTTHGAAAGQTYLVCDGEDVSTAQLVEQIAAALGHRSHLFNFPPGLLRAVASLLGRSEQVDRLLDSLRVSNAKIRNELDWLPPNTLAQGLRETTQWYLTRKSK